MIKLNTGLVRTKVERDNILVGEICFNPASTSFKEQVVAFIKDIEKKQAEWTTRATEIDNITKEEDRIKVAMKFEREFFGYFANAYVKLFGEGADVIIQGVEPLDRETAIQLFDNVVNNWVVPELQAFTKGKEALYSGKSGRKGKA